MLAGVIEELVSTFPSSTLLKFCEYDRELAIASYAVLYRYGGNGRGLISHANYNNEDTAYKITLLTLSARELNLPL